MPSRQDQLHSYQFMIQRVVAALVMRETDPNQAPFKRAMGATMVSLLISALAMGGVAAYALFTGSGATTNKDNDVVLIEKETGANYVRKEGRLYPMLNYASAVLIAGKNEKRTVSQSSLRNEARAPMIGIVGAPTSITEVRRLLKEPWTICTMTDDVSQRARSILKVGKAVTAGTVFAPGEAALVKDAPGAGAKYYLIWNNNRYLLKGVTGENVVSDKSRAALVSQAFLNAFPAANDIEKIAITDAGKQSQKLSGRRIGTVFSLLRPSDGSYRWFVVVAKGYAEIAEFDVDVLLADPQYREITGTNQVQSIEESALGDNVVENTPANGIPGNRGSLIPVPAKKPHIIEPTKGLCAQASQGGVTELRHSVPLDPIPARTSTETPQTPPGQPVKAAVDQIDMAPGAGVLVQDMTAPGVPSGALAIVQNGKRYNMTEAVRGMFGYGSAQPVQIMTALSDLIPRGPALDPDAAKKPTDGSGPTAQQPTG